MKRWGFITNMQTFTRQTDRRRGWIGKTVAFALLCTSTLSGSSSNLSPDLQNATSTTDVIIQFTSPPNNTTLGSVTANGGMLKRQLGLTNAAVYSLPPAVIAALANNPNVKYATPDRVLQGALEFAEPTTNANIALQYGFNGTGIGVAVIDSGVLASHPDLQSSNNSQSRVVYSQSFVPNDPSSGDAYGHGTHVAGIVSGNGTASSGGNAIYTFRGIAPNANIINLRVLDWKGAGTDSEVINAIQQAILLKGTYNIRVINLSLGRQVFESYTLDPLCQAVEQAWKAGIVVVVAAGNNGRDNSENTYGYSTITSPGNDPLVITVGAMKDMRTLSRGDDLMASYSSKGPTLLDHVVKPDLVAPGNGIISALANNSTIVTTFPNNVVPISYYKSSSANVTSPNYFTLSGTSMAAPMVSGAAALLLQQNGSLTPDAVKARLMKTATKSFPFTSVVTVGGVSYTDYYDIFTVGAGYLDVWAALNSTDTVPVGSTAASPIAQYNALTNTVTLVNTNSVIWGTPIWGSSLVWGDTIVWGSSLVLGDTIVWGSSLVWGDSTLQGFSIVWGDSIVWAASNPFSTAVSISGE